MFSGKMHVFIKRLDAYHVSFGIICQLDFLTAAYALCSPVEISHIYRTTYFAGNCVKSGFPAFDCLTCSLWCKCQVNDRSPFHFVDYTEYYIASPFSIYRDTAHLAQQPSEWSPK